MATADRWCNDGHHKVPVIAEKDADHKRVWVVLACTHAKEVFVGRLLMHCGISLLGTNEYCSDCHEECPACDEDLPHQDIFTEAYVDLGGG